MGFLHLDYQHEIDEWFAKTGGEIICRCGCGKSRVLVKGEYKLLRRYVILKSYFYLLGHHPLTKRFKKLAPQEHDYRWKGGPGYKYTCACCGGVVKRKGYGKPKKGAVCHACTQFKRRIFGEKYTPYETKRGDDMLRNFLQGAEWGKKSTYKISTRSIPHNIKMCAVLYVRACDMLKKKSRQKMYKPRGLTRGMTWSKGRNGYEYITQGHYQMSKTGRRVYIAPHLVRTVSRKKSMRIAYEKAYGPIPFGFILRKKHGAKNRYAVENFIAVSKTEHVRINRLVGLRRKAINVSGQI